MIYIPAKISNSVSFEIFSRNLAKLHESSDAQQLWKLREGFNVCWLIVKMAPV